MMSAFTSAFNRRALQEFFSLNAWKIALLIATAFIFLFVNLPAMQNPCNWLVCPDFAGTDIVATHVNFYEPAGYRCGFMCVYHDAFWAWGMLAYDIVAWLVVNGIIFSVFYASKTDKK